jgi:RNA polymerase sigma-70 factor, ECF subfamily
VFRKQPIYAGEQGAAEFERVVRAHQSMVFSIALRMLGDRMMAEDVAQEVFMQLYAMTQQWQSAEHVTAWLRRTTVYRAIDATRRAKARPECAFNVEPSFGIDVGDPLFSLRCKELMAILSPEARAVMVLRYQEDLKPTEIATTLNMRLATVKSHLKRSLESFREKLGVRTRPVAVWQREDEQAHG